ncbi:MAG TPA: TRAP transporter substrate-binding protein [Clostridiales bacterium]|nr:TRAP transporter substrate-binding protein [Clostridiales bacterium]
MKKKLVSLVSSLLCFALLLSACGKAPAKDAGNNTDNKEAQNTTVESDGSKEDAGKTKEQIVIKAGHHTAEDGAWQVGFEAFAKAIAELSNDRFKVEIYPAGQLGDQTELIQQLQLGTVQCAVSSCADLGNFAPSVGLLDVPYLFETKEQAWNAMDGEVGQIIATSISEEAGVSVMGYWSGGTRSVFSSKGPINTVEDLKGLKIRTQPNDIHVKSFEALGALVTPIAYTELYSALQQGVIDAAENDPSNFYQMKFYEVCKYYSLTEHIQQVATGIALVSQKFYDSLTDEEKGWFNEACAIAQKEQRSWVEDTAAGFIEKLEAEGVMVNQVEKESFVEEIQPFYEKYVYTKYGTELVEMIKNTPKE